MGYHSYPKVASSHAKIDENWAIYCLRVLESIAKSCAVKQFYKGQGVLTNLTQS